MQAIPPQRQETSDHEGHRDDHNGDTRSPAPSRSPRGAVTAAGLIVFATVTLTPWLLTSSSDSLRPITPPHPQHRRSKQRPQFRPAPVRTREAPNPWQGTPCSARTAPACARRRRPLAWTLVTFDSAGTARPSASPGNRARDREIVWPVQG